MQEILCSFVSAAMGLVQILPAIKWFVPGAFHEEVLFISPFTVLFNSHLLSPARSIQIIQGFCLHRNFKIMQYPITHTTITPSFSIYWQFLTELILSW